MPSRRRHYEATRRSTRAAPPTSSPRRSCASRSCAATPDFEIGANLDREAGTFLGLPLGIQVPLFDRNQVEIARATGARDEARAGYRAEVERTLSAVAGALALAEARWRAWRSQVELVMPEAERAEATTKKALEAGGTDALRYLAVIVEVRRAHLTTLLARNQLFEALLALESACGVPLLAFPGEPGLEGHGSWQCDFPPPQPCPGPNASNAKEGE